MLLIIATLMPIANLIKICSVIIAFVLLVSTENVIMHFLI